MASIVKRNGKFCVVYMVDSPDGKRRQKWQTFDTYEAAKNRRSEVEYTQTIGEFTIPDCRTVSELMSEYISLYGKTKWSISAYNANTSLIRNYIEPMLGKTKLSDITTRTLEKYYLQLLRAHLSRGKMKFG
ncbi:MAG: hypothetical protein IJ083_05595 [Clostridia bacterium]|nr:hypothetical protein [Clostridia bacterium]